MIKFLQKGDYYLSMMRVAHCFFVRVEIICGDEEKHFVSKPAFLEARKKKHYKVTNLYWKGNRGTHGGRSLELII